jgi:RNA-binding protein YlmH
MIDKQLEARLSDLARSARRGVPCATAFLSPEETADADEYLVRHSLRYAAFGGYCEAERSMIVLLPDYLEPEYLDWDDFFMPIAILTSGYVELSHRSFLGALIALGIDRSAMGDILLFPFGAVVFVLPSIADFLLTTPSPLLRVGADKVRVCRCDQSPATREIISAYQRKFEPFTDVVASARLDCAVSSFARTSREKAKAMVLAGQVYLNHQAVIHPDAIISEGDVISIRGIGKFRISNMKLTQKERIRIEAKRYV